jgi:hypothetical protein
MQVLYNDAYHESLDEATTYTPAILKHELERALTFTWTEKDQEEKNKARGGKKTNSNNNKNEKDRKSSDGELMKLESAEEQLALTELSFVRCVVLLVLSPSGLILSRNIKVLPDLIGKLTSLKTIVRLSLLFCLFIYLLRFFFRSFLFRFHFFHDLGSPEKQTEFASCRICEPEPLDVTQYVG